MSPSRLTNKPTATSGTQSSTGGAVVSNPYTPTSKKRKTDDSGAVDLVSPVSASTNGNTSTASVSSVKSHTTGPPTGDKAIKSIKWGKKEQVQPKITEMCGFVKLSSKKEQMCSDTISYDFHNKYLRSLCFLFIFVAVTNTPTKDDMKCDPRGFAHAIKNVPYTYCQYCRCPRSRCHNLLYGRFCELKVVHAVAAEYGEPITDESVEEIFFQSYNSALEFNIFVHTDQLDVKTGGYELPFCIKDHSMDKSIQYIQFKAYHFDMHRRIMNGPDELEGGQAHFYEITY
jgi:hypothetical protein